MTPHAPPMAPISDFRGEYAFLSNFFPSPFVLHGTRFDTVEHAYQAIKSHGLDPDHFEAVVGAHTPGEAKRLGRHGPAPDNWDSIKDNLMTKYVHEKFVQNPDLARRLVDTGEAELIEGNWWGDTYWGVCRGVGLNKLGQILMRERQWQREYGVGKEPT